VADDNSIRAGDVIAAYPLFQEGSGGSLPTSALQFKIVEIGMRLAAELNREWHSMLPRTDLGNLLCGSTSVAYAAEFSSGYFAVGIWTQPIIRACCDGATIELRRLAINDSAPKNTASRMLSVMRRMVKRKFPFLNRAVSYLAVDNHKGTIYRADNWKPVGAIVAARPQRFSNINKNTRATGPLQTTSRKQRWEISL
jgi:hypothetical protein